MRCGIAVLAWVGLLSGQVLPELVTTDEPSVSGVAGCPRLSGILDVFAVPARQSVGLALVLPGPAPEGGASFDLRSLDTTIATAGEARQGNLLRVVIEQGKMSSAAFRVFGTSAGRTDLEITAVTEGYTSRTVLLAVWDVNPTGPTQFVDANPPAKPCREPGASAISTNPAILATCGAPVQGVATDGVSPLLLRTGSGLAGTACFEIVSVSTVGQGAVGTGVASTATVGDLDYGFSLYQPPMAFEGTGDTREVIVEFSFTPSTERTNTTRTRATFSLVRPPVVLLHGLWSSASNWADVFIRNDASRTTFVADYSATAGANFSVNIPLVRGFIDSVLNQARAKGFAGNQADIVGHSMGGLLGRLHLLTPAFRSPETLGQGDLRRLVTLDTPHFGSSFSNLLVELHRVAPTDTEKTISDITGGLVTQGAVCDLSENSPALQALSSGSPIRAQVISSTGGPAGTATAPAKFWGGVLGYDSFESALTDYTCLKRNWVFECVEKQFTYPQETVNAFRFRQQNDAIVPLTSQQGGAGSGFNYPDLVHFHIPLIGGGVTDDSSVASKVFEILDGPDSGLVNGLPPVPSNGGGAPVTTPGRGVALDQADYLNQCVKGGPMNPGATFQTAAGAVQRNDSRVKITAPADGATFEPGQQVTVEVALESPLLANNIALRIPGIGRVSGTNYDGRRFQAIFAAPRNRGGTITLLPEITDSNNLAITGTPSTILVTPVQPLEEIGFVEHFYQLNVALGTTGQLHLRGRYSDGWREANRLGAGYSSSNPGILQVDAAGLYRVTGRGTAVVTVQFNEMRDFAIFHIDDHQSPMPPLDVSDSVRVEASGLRFHNDLGLYVQDVRVANRSRTAVPGRLALVISNLAETVGIPNRHGLTQVITPVNSHYFLVRPDNGRLYLAPGEGISFQIQYLGGDATLRPPDFRVYRYPHTP